MSSFSFSALFWSSSLGPTHSPQLTQRLFILLLPMSLYLSFLCVTDTYSAGPKANCMLKKRHSSLIVPWSRGTARRQWNSNASAKAKRFPLDCTEVEVTEIILAKEDFFSCQVTVVRFFIGYRFFKSIWRSLLWISWGRVFVYLFHFCPYFT
jgi:hypothetical protein